MEVPSSFSIIIPTYQRRDRVCDTLRSICRLEYNGTVEVIVVVDGSTDGTAAALARIECPFPVHVIEQTNCGAGGARNRGAAEANGDILLFLDDDMTCEPDLLARHAADHGTGADAVVGDFVETGSGIAGLIAPTHERRSFQCRGRPITTFDMFGGHISVSLAAYEHVGGYDASFTNDGRYGCEDFDIGHRLLKNYTVVRNFEAVCHHRKSLSPREYIRRARSCADSEARLLRKHPELRCELFRWSGASSMSNRLRLLSRIPVLPGIVAEVVAVTASIGSSLPFRSSRVLAATL